MAISFTRYIDITSGIGAGNRVAGRELIGRLFSTSDRLPTDTIATFTAASEVADYFGSASEEYKRAAFYFGWISKTQVRPRKLSFVRFAIDGAAASLLARNACAPLADFQAIDDGAFLLAVDDNQVLVKDVDLSGATAYADVADLVQTAVRTAGVADAVVAFDSRSRTFSLKAGAAGDGSIGPAMPQGASGLVDALRWTAASGALVSPGKDASTVTDALNHAFAQDNNFGSFLFVGFEPTVEEMLEAATVAHLSNVGLMYCQGVTTANAHGVAEALKGCSGVALTERDPATTDAFADMVPMILLAATDYSRRNGTMNYMFTQFDLPPTVTENAKADLLDEIRVNYYGRTQQAGQTIDFYQRGVLLGEIQDMNVYANEMWLKDACGAAIMTLLLSLPKISANARGRALVKNALREGPVETALLNGTISIEKDLAFRQKAFITEITGDENAWIQVQTQGFWLDVQIEEITVDDRIEYRAVYTLIYAKDDVIRKAVGTHSLI